MYQIFVVEDELLIRQNIRGIIEGMQGPYAFAGEASDGEMALSMIQDLMPDILLTDIRMPFLDGLSLIKHAKVIMPWLKVAVISGYGDFEYAQRAISMGVNLYLLKPVRQAELVQAIHSLAAQLEQERSASSMGAVSIEQADVRQALKRSWMEEVLYERPALSPLLDRAQALNLDIVKGHYLATLISFDSSDADLYRVKAIVEKTLLEAGCELYLFNTADHMTLLQCGNDLKAMNERVYQLITILRHELQEVCPVVTAVISRETSRLGEVGKSCREAWQTMRALRNIRAGRVINLNDATPDHTDILDRESPFGKAFQEKLLFADPDDVPSLVDEALQGEGNGPFESMLIRYQTLVSVLQTAAEMACGSASPERLRAWTDEIAGQFDLLAAAGSKSSFRGALIGILQAGLREKSRRTDNGSSYRHVISRAEQYTRDHFCDPNISLLSVAQHVGMSSAYFSTVFSQTTGQSFISFLTALRMEKARELLTGTRMRLSDIAMEIGYNEPNYFSHVFRKVTGVTPKEYRQQHGG